MLIKAISFKRTKESKWEAGVTFEGAEEPIFDSKGKTVPLPVYDIEDYTHILTLDLIPIFKEINEQLKHKK